MRVGQLSQKESPEILPKRQYSVIQLQETMGGAPLQEPGPLLPNTYH